MRFGINVSNIGDYSDPRFLAELAHEAEDAGWDGFFLWDTIRFGPPDAPACDPWVALAAIAMRTERMRIGTLVTPLARRRPWKLARETVSIDHLSGGRLILGVGVGDEADGGFAQVGEVLDARQRAVLLDEGLAVLTGLWSGEPFAFDGTAYHVQSMTFLPKPIQSPRIPIWVGGYWPLKAPMRRAARWDGVYPGKKNADGTMSKMTPADLRDLKLFLLAQRADDAAFDIVQAGATPGTEAAQATAIIAPFAEAGVTWWLENLSFRRGSSDAMRARVRQGPPSTN